MQFLFFVSENMYVQKIFSPIFRPCVLFFRSFSTVKSPPLELTKELITRLERLSALRMRSHESHNLAEDINVAEGIFDVDTRNVDLLYNVVEDYTNCPLRDDLPKKTSINETLANARKTFEGFFVAPSVGIYDKQEKECDVKRDE